MKQWNVKVAFTVLADDAETAYSTAWEATTRLGFRNDKVRDAEISEIEETRE